MDRREAILVRLLAVCETVPGFVTVARNRIALDDLKLPAMSMIDGGEEADDSDPPSRPTSTPRRVTMSPRVIMLAQGSEETIGTILNGYRAALIKAICGDADLESLTKLGPGKVRLQACNLMIDPARSTVGSMSVDFSITYVLRPDEL